MIRWKKERQLEQLLLSALYLDTLSKLYARTRRDVRRRNFRNESGESAK